MSSRDLVFNLIDNQEVDKAFEFVSKLSDSDAETWYLRGKVFSRVGKLQEAFSCYNKALAIDSTHEEAAVMLELSKSIYSFKDPNLFNH